MLRQLFEALLTEVYAVWWIALTAVMAAAYVALVYLPPRIWRWLHWLVKGKREVYDDGEK